jgi:Rrf2 family protein
MSSLLKISEAAVLALHAMILLAKRREMHLSVHDIAEKLGASEHHLAKVMQRLTKAGLVVSVRGPRGGFLLSKDAEKANLLDVLTSVDGPVQRPECLLGLCQCVVPPCILDNTLEDINRLVVEQLKKISLKQYFHS